MKSKSARWWNKRYHTKFRCRFNDFRTKIQILGETAWLWRRNRSKIISKKKNKVNEIKPLKEETENKKDKLLY